MLPILVGLGVAAPPATPDGSVEGYVRSALAHHPDLVADRALWREAVERIPGQRTPPEPQVSVGGFVQSVETRVGPQQVRVGVQQTLPWPTRLVQAGKAAAADADAAEQGVEATRRELRARVEASYWTLWRVRAARALHAEHLTILEGLAATVRGRVEVGTAALADLQQVELTRSRLEDTLASLEAEEEAQVALLRAAVGIDVGGAPTTSEPALAPLPDGDALGATSHPQLRAMDATASAAGHRARAAAGQRLPDLTVGADWIATGPARTGGLADSGKDAVIVGLGVKVPLWQGTYGHDVAAARRAEESVRARRVAREDELRAAIEATTARVHDSARRVERVDRTLLPQAEAAYQAVLGEYAVGRAGVSQTLLAQRDLLELAIERVQAQADHERLWARLTALTGIAP